MFLEVLRMGSEIYLYSRNHFKLEYEAQNKIYVI